MSRSTEPRGFSTPYDGSPAPGWDEGAAIPAPLAMHSATVGPDWVDYNGHMSESCYLLAFGDSADALFRYVGIDEAYRAAGRSVYTVETHLRHLAGAVEGDPLRLTVRLLDLDAKRLHVFHAMFHDRSGELLATAEQLLVHVDATAGRVVAFPDALAGRLEAILAAHRRLPVPEGVGNVMRIGPRAG